MEIFGRRLLRELSSEHKPPCFSLYMPTERGKLGAQQNHTRFKNLKRKATELMERQYDKAIRSPILAQLDLLSGDQEFWDNQRDGLGIFVANDYLKTIALKQALPELCFVSKCFHIKPLIRTFQSADGFHLLAVTRDHIRLYQGNRYELNEVPLHEVFNFADFSHNNEGGRHVAARSFLGGMGRGSVRYYNFDDIRAKKKLDIEKFFAAVDDMVHEEFSKPSGLPLIIAALPEYQHVFRRHHHVLNFNAGIFLNPDSLSENDLLKKAWQILQPKYEQLTHDLVEEFNTAKNHGRGSDQLGEVLQAVLGRKVSKLIIAQEKNIPGELDFANRKILPAQAEQPGNDLLDAFADIVIQSRGEVIVLPTSKMPTKTGLAAIYRF